MCARAMKLCLCILHVQGSRYTCQCLSNSVDYPVVFVVKTREHYDGLCIKKTKSDHVDPISSNGIACMKKILDQDSCTQTKENEN